MKSYHRVMLGKGSMFAETCLSGDFIGTDFEIAEDLTGKLPDDWHAFNSEYIPVYQANCPGKSKIAAGLACGALWTVSRGIRPGDLVLCPNGSGLYHVGEVVGEYSYHPEGILPHRRDVHWLDQTIDRADMTDELKHSTGSAGTVANVTPYADEIETLLGAKAGARLTDSGDDVKDPWKFAMEKHLEDFLLQNWEHTELGKDYDIYTDDNGGQGQQFPVDTGYVDIFAVRKDCKELLVIELKKGRASDAVVGQILRYMGFVKEEMAEDGQTVKGIIIALEDDQRIRRALVMVPDVRFYRYQVNFKLVET